MLVAVLTGMGGSVVVDTAAAAQPVSKGNNLIASMKVVHKDAARGTGHSYTHK